MRRVPHNRQDLLLLVSIVVGMVVILTVIAVLAPPPTTGNDRTEPSSFFDRAWGTMAFYRLIEWRGGQAVRSGRPLDQRAFQAATGLVLPVRPREFAAEYLDDLDPDDWAALHRWVEAGGRMLLLDRYPLSPPAGDVDLSGHWRQRRVFADEKLVEVSRDLQHEILLGVRHLALTGDPAEAGTIEPLPWPYRPSERLVVEDQNGQDILVIERHGLGWVIQPTTTFLLSNYGLGRSDNSVLAYNLAGFLSRSPDQDRGLVVFSEFHLGYREVTNPYWGLIRLMFDPSWRWALAQLMLGGILALLMSGWRMGRPQRVPPVRRRRQGSLVDGAAAILAAGRDAHQALTVIQHHHRRRVCERLGLPASADDRALTAALHRRLADLEWAWRPLVRLPENRALGEDAALKCAQGFCLVMERLSDESE